MAANFVSSPSQTTPGQLLLSAARCVSVKGGGAAAGEQEVGLLSGRAVVVSFVVLGRRVGFERRLPCALPHVHSQTG